MKLSTKLSVFFALLAAIPVIILSVLNFFNVRVHFTQMYIRSMEKIASDKKKQLIRMLEEHTEAVTLFANKPGLVIALQNYTVSPNPQDQETMVTELKDIISKNSQYRSIHIHDTTGHDLASSHNHDTQTDEALHVCHDYANGSQPIVKYIGYGSTAFSCRSYPVIHDGNTLGMVVFQIAIDDMLAVAGDYKGLGESGETIILTRNDKGEVTSLTPLRFDPNAAFSHALARTEASNPVNRVMAKVEESSLNSLDYRGVQVVSVTRHIPEADIGLVVKMDYKEVVAPVYRYLMQDIMLTGVIIVIGSVLSYFLAGSITKPIKKITFISSQISQGDLSQRIDYRSVDELGVLAQSFNQMAERLSQSHRELERKVTERTRELEDTKKNLEEKIRTIESANRTMIGREIAMVELKHIISDLKAELETYRERHGGAS